MTKTYRQGDVFFELVKRPDGALVPVPLDGGAVVLAYGESSGHRHQIARGAKLFRFRDDGARYLEVSAKGGATVRVTNDRGGKLLVERHDPVTLPPGIYRVTVQREWTAAMEVRNVHD
jgi:hypothetical protein